MNPPADISQVEFQLARLDTVPLVWVSTMLADSFGDGHGDGLSAWKALVSADVASGRCCRMQSRVAVADTGAIVGAVLAYPDVGPGTWRLGATGVSAQWRRRGVGQTMVAALLKNAEHAGAHMVRCEVEASNAAGYRFFEEMGFSCDGLLVDYSLNRCPGNAASGAVMTSHWDAVARIFKGGAGLRSPALIASQARMPGAMVFELSGHGAALVRGRWLIDIAVPSGSEWAFRELLSAIYTAVGRVLWRHVDADSLSSDMAARLGLQSVAECRSLRR